MKRPDILKAIADAHYQLADLYTQLASDTPDAGTSGGPVAVAPPAAPAETWEGAIPIGMDATVDEGSEAVCPKHRTPYKDGNYGPFCTQMSDDPAWSNRKGYCSLTPKNAAQYLRVRAAA